MPEMPFSAESHASGHASGASAMSRVPRPPSSPRRPRNGRRAPHAPHPLHERIQRCSSVPETAEAMCFLCENDKWRYERPELKIREKKKDRKVKEEENEKDNLYSLMLALSKVCKHRDAAGDRMPSYGGADLWTWLLEPLRSLVPCEEVKFVVRCLGPVPATPQLPFSHDAEVGVAGWLVRWNKSVSFKTKIEGSWGIRSLNKLDSSFEQKDLNHHIDSH